MGCGGSKPEPEPTKLESPNKVQDDEMAKIREKLAAQQAKVDAGEVPMKRSTTFKRKFKGFQAGGGGKHEVKRAVDMSPEAVAEREAIKAKIEAKKEPGGR